MATILVIDDQPEVRKSLVRLLERAGYETMEEEDGHAALRHYAGRPADLVITDIFMPEMDGIEFIMRVKEVFPEAEIIAMSGGGALDRKSVLGAASQLGAAAVFEKPFDAAELLGTVGRLLESKTE